MSWMNGQSVRQVLLRPSATYAKPKSVQSFGRAALAAIVAVMLAQTLFLVWGCDWDLCGDEAEYWAWSRKLDWSYFSRGPAVAWMIRLGTELLGWLSLKLTGSLMFAVRFPCVVLGGITGWGVYRLAGLTIKSARTSLIAVLLLPAIPVLALGGVIATSDTPLVCCWVWAAVWCYRAIQRDDLRAWVAAGAIGAVGVMAKYSFLAMLASVGMFLLLSTVHRRQLARPGFWVMSLIAGGLGLAPIVLWNLHHGWAGANQLADRVGLSHRASWASIYPVVTFLGGEILALGVIWWFVGLRALGDALCATLSHTTAEWEEQIHHRVLGRAHRPALSSLSLGSPLVRVPLRQRARGNRSQLDGAGLYLTRCDHCDAGRPGISRGGGRARAVIAGWCFSIAAVVAVHHTEWFYPAIARWVPSPTNRWAAPFRLYEPTARLRGHQVVARAVAEKVKALAAKGESPYVLTATYGLSSTLSFYLPGWPEAYCLSWNYGMTSAPVNQHDLWHPNPRHEPEAFANRTAVIVEDSNMPPSYSWHMHRKGVFGTLESSERLVVRERGVIIGSWDIAVCRDYRGLAGYKQNPLARGDGGSPGALR